jgi:hypothetical protein
MANESIYILDRLVAQPGQGEALHRRYLDEYVPVASERGLTLEHRWVSPPMWLEGGQSNTLLFVWSVKGVEGYWGVEARARFDSASGDWWREIEPMLVSRTRSVMSEASDIASLTDV